VDEFRYYCRPVKNPILTEFCTELTGITQVILFRKIIITLKYRNNLLLSILG